MARTIRPSADDARIVTISSTLDCSMLTAKVPSGIDALDDVWEGLCRGSAYLFYGRAQTGRSLLMLQMARAAVEANEPTILVSPRKPRDLSVLAETIGFDLEDACRGGRLRLLRVSPALMRGVDDDDIDAALRDLTRLACEQRPARLIIEDYTPFVRYRRFDRVRASMLRFLDAVAESDTTTLLGLGEPANAQSEKIVSFLRGQLAGAIHLAADSDAPASTARRLTLQPPLGSREPERRIAWDLIRLQEHLPTGAEQPMGVRSHDDDSYAETPPYPHNGDGKYAEHADRPFIELSIPTAPVSDHRESDHRESEPSPESRTDRTAAPSEAEAPIHYIDATSPPGSAPEVEDPFAAVGTRGSLFERSHYIEGRCDEPDAGRAEVPAVAPLAYGSRSPEEPQVVGTESEVPESGPTDEAVAPDRQAAPADARAAFEIAFDAAVARYQSAGEPFLSIGLRAGATPEGALHFPAVVDALRRSLGDEDALFADVSSGRAAVVLPGRTQDAVQPLFREVKSQLRSAGLAAADTTIRTLLAAVVPHGRPFTTGDDFLRFVLESD